MKRNYETRSSESQWKGRTLDGHHNCLSDSCLPTPVFSQLNNPVFWWGQVLSRDKQCPSQVGLLSHPSGHIASPYKDKTLNSGAFKLSKNALPSPKEWREMSSYNSGSFLLDIWKSKWTLSVVHKHLYEMYKGLRPIILHTVIQIRFCPTWDILSPCQVL